MIQAPVSCQATDAISSKPRTQGDHAANIVLAPKALTYDWNGHEDMPIMGAQFSDFEIAAKVRMLMRDQLDHEAVCVMARDRIMGRSKQAAEMLTALKAAEEWLSGWASAEPYLQNIRDVIAKAEGRSAQ